MYSTDARRLPSVALACLLVAPAAIFFLAAVGRSFQPVTHEPARTLDAVVTWFAGLPSAELGLMLLLLPAIGLALAIRQLWLASGDESVRADLRSLAEASGRFVRRPALVASILVLVFGGLYFLAIAVHAVAG